MQNLRSLGSTCIGVAPDCNCELTVVLTSHHSDHNLTDLFLRLMMVVQIESPRNELLVIGRDIDAP